jgi:hypothetical protein
MELTTNLIKKKFRRRVKLINLDLTDFDIHVYVKTTPEMVWLKIY